MKKYRIKVCGWNKTRIIYDGKLFDKGKCNPIVNYYENNLRKGSEYLNDSIDKRFEYTIEVFERVECSEKLIHFYDSTK